MQPIHLTVPLSRGSVTLRAWGAHQTDALTLDLMTVTGTLGELRGGEYPDATPQMVEQHIWQAFFRLVRLSLDGIPLPQTTFMDRLLLLEAMWELNDVEVALGKLKGLSERAQQAMSRHLATLTQAHQTTPSTSSS